jgi:hypothetical protein
MMTIKFLLAYKKTKRLFFLMIIANLLYLPHMISQEVAVKSNILYNASTSMHIALETSLGPQWTLELPVSYNPWVFSANKKFKHWLIQPELRYWWCEKFNGHFMGFHLHTAGYNVGGIEWLGLKNSRYQGNLYGAGFSYGYQWILNTRWSLEATIGLGYAYLSYAEYPCERCAPKTGDSSKNYVGPTKAGLSLIYVIK